MLVGEAAAVEAGVGGRVGLVEWEKGGRAKA